jgi:hypothetical protein
MARTTVTRAFWPGLFALAVASCGGETVIGDGPETGGGGPADSGGSGSGGGGDSGGSGSTDGGGTGPGVDSSPPTCDASVGSIPAPNCEKSTPILCQAMSSTCDLGTAAMCGESTCLPMTNNVAPVDDFRISSLQIISPPVLASLLIQESIVNPSVTLNAPSCGYGPSSPETGAFNWLLSIDRSKSQLTTGGGGPVSDPYAAGYCFVNETSGTVHLGAVTSPVSFAGDTFSSEPASTPLNVPIFLTRTDLSLPLVLPIRGLQFSDATISADGNCIGSLNPEWAASAGKTCSEAVESCPKWFPNGAITGYITLRDANMIKVQLTGQTLCVLLLGASVSGSSCTSADFDKGDYCSTGGSCKDSLWFSATFAASAVKINDSTAPPCGP